jgi:hypothetical protein
MGAQVLCTFSLTPLVPSHLAGPRFRGYTRLMQRKMFWISFTVMGLLADLILPFWWAVAATVPALALSWWIAYRSEWF